MSRRLAPVLAITALFVALVTPVILAGDRDTTGGARDDRDFHLPTILKLSEELPEPDLRNINTATSPGYHLVLSVTVRAGVNDLRVLQGIAALFSLAMVLAAFFLLTRYVDEWLAFALTLPLLFSHYVLQSSAWLNTDNAAVLFVVLSIGAALTVEATGRGLVRGGLFVFLAVWVRQLTLWVAGPFVFAAAVAGGWVPGLRRSGDPARPDRRVVLLAALALVPALASLAALIATWGQLTPPGFKQSGISPTAAPTMLALAGMFGVFFAVGVVRRSDVVEGRAPRLAALGAVLLAAAIPTAEATENDDWIGGGLWKAVDLGPVLADRSLVITALAPVGAVVLVALWRVAERHAMRRPAAVLFVALLSLTAAQVATVRTYQRYFEPALLVILALLTALGPIRTGAAGGEVDARARRVTLIAMSALAVVQLVGCAVVVYGPLD